MVRGVRTRHVRVLCACVPLLTCATMSLTQPCVSGAPPGEVTTRAAKELAAAAEALRHDDGAEQLREQLAQSRQVRAVRVRSRGARGFALVQ